MPIFCDSYVEPTSIYGGNSREQMIFGGAQVWHQASNYVICTWDMESGHAGGCFIFMFSHGDWDSHSGGGGMIMGTVNSGYDSPGVIFTENSSFTNGTEWLAPSAIRNHLSFNLNDSSNDIQLRVSNAAPSSQYGPVVQVCMWTQAHGVFSFS